MPFVPNFRSGNRPYAFALILLLCVCAICVAFSVGDNNGFETSRTEVLLRRIGHEVLLQSGDSVSRVMPVEKMGEDEYRISFEKELSFQPDSLVNITRRLLGNDLRSADYIVNVLNCGSSSVAYGYAISREKKDDIISCQGRKQPKGCYMISIRFKPASTNTAKFAIGGLALLAFIGYIFMRPAKSREIPVDVQTPGTFSLGSMSFNPDTRTLMLNGHTTDLTVTENRVLLLLALSPNETIQRSRLQKEIWEDEGVIVGRSLDMFISKLRKKLEPDPDVKIVVIRGKGYKLEIKS